MNEDGGEVAAVVAIVCGSRDCGGGVIGGGEGSGQVVVVVRNEGERDMGWKKK